ncbi:hypothetical protein AGOR_G00205140 [Albula goreensis]|uniref:Uncharacterized protein n=1 Tax=Albula goreensis TaxID=1534307 RepID=A0A8T3CSS9_9TELE|nr:hypothetical protein AGOR_G00205140 [Albula goreensis]
MLQENEGYTLTDAGVVATPVPSDSKCNIGCCHSRWSCDGSRFGSSKSSTYVPVQKCLSDANVLVAEMDCSLDTRQPEEPKCPGFQFQPVDRDLGPLDYHVNPASAPPPYSNTKAPRRNETLERKTAEFNRTLFQAEMGRGVEDTVIPTEVSYVLDREVEEPPVERNLSAFRQYVPSVSTSMARASSPGVRTVTAARQACEARSGRTGTSARGTGESGSWVLKDQPWKPTTLAAYPRPADSRSNYGAVEKILKSFESSGGAQLYLQRRPSPGQEDDLIELLDMLEVKQQQPSLGQRLTYRDTPPRLGLHRDMTSTVQESKESSTVSVKKSFSRPARPANRRLPSRWASRSPTSPSGPAMHPSIATQTRTFSYSYQTETVII